MRRMSTGTSTTQITESSQFIVEGRPNAAAVKTSEQGSEIRNHLKWWQAQQAERSQAVDAQNLPGFNSSGHTQNSVTQTGEYDPNDLSKAIDEDDDIHSAIEPETAPDADGQVQDATSGQQLPRKGDMVSLPGQQGQIGIITRAGKRISEVYTVHGDIHCVLSRLMVFRVGKFVSVDELAPLSPFLLTDEAIDEAEEKDSEIAIVIPRDVGAPLIHKMRQFIDLADECYRQYASRLDHIWDIIAPTESANVFTLEEIASKIFEKPSMSALSMPMLWSLYRVILRDDRFWWDARFHNMLPRFTLEPVNNRDKHLVVMEWVREFQDKQASDTTVSFHEKAEPEAGRYESNPIYTFIEKARELIQRSREVRELDSLGQLGISKAGSAIRFPQPSDNGLSLSFDPNEKKIVQCLVDWAAIRKLKDSSPCASIGPAILKSLGLYDGLTLDTSAGHLLLKEIGVITPWENLAIYARAFLLPGHGLDINFDDMRKLAQQSDLTLKDSMEGLRKDWGDMPVFCIDSFSTVDRDDGVSWESAGEGTSWIHVHIANPSAFVGKDSSIAMYAAKLSKTLYLAERRYPMFENELLGKHCSLAPDCPSITFSARMSDGGDILETKITHGILRNIKYLTPETIGKYVLSETQQLAQHPVITVGGAWRAESGPRCPTLTQSEIEILSKLRDLGSARRRNRNLLLPYQEAREEPEVDLGEGHPPFGPVLDGSRRILGDPVIAFRAIPLDAPSQTRSFFVDDLMLIAGEVAAIWSAERGLPIAYVGSPTDPKSEPALDALVEDVLRPLTTKGIRHPRPVVAHFFTLTGGVSLSLKPLKHRFLDLPRYCQITSPLRRYRDLFCQWQIDAAVRYEAKTGRSLIGNTDDHFLPFSHAEAAQVVKDDDVASVYTNVLSKRTKRHWISQWFHRAYFHHEAPLPETFTAHVTRIDPVMNTIYGNIKELNIPCVLQEGAAARTQKKFREGETWEVRPERVDTYKYSILAKPLRRLEDAPVEAEEWTRYKEKYPVGELM